LGLHERMAVRGQALARCAALPVYLGSLLLGSVGVVAWMLLRHHGVIGAGVPPGWALFGAVLMMFPASEAVVAVINRLISESVRPQRLPRLALSNGIPPEHRVMVVIPAMLATTAS